MISGVELAGTFLAGLGLLFIGIKQLGANMKEIAGKRFRRFLTGVTGNPFTSALAGILTGIITQSVNAVTFIMASLIAAKSLTVSKALPLLAWANAGTTLVVFLATLNIKVAVFYLIGVVGLGFYFDLDKSSKHRHVLGGLLGVAILFLGVAMLKIAAEPLKEMPWVDESIRLLGGSAALLLLLGAVLAFVAQSSTTVAAIAAAMTLTGLLPLVDAIWLVAGANAGSGASMLILGSGLKGAQRQLAIYQGIFKLVGTVIAVITFAFTSSWVAQAPTSNPGTTLAFAFLFMQLVSVLVLLPLHVPFCRLLARLSPETNEERLSALEFIYEQAAHDPASAVDLVNCELARVAGLFPDLLEPMRAEPEKTPVASPDEISRACHALLGAIGSFSEDLHERAPAREVLVQISSADAIAQLLHSLLVSYSELGLLRVRSGESPVIVHLRHLLVEALHLTASLTPELLVAESDDYELLEKITADRSRQMEDTRARMMLEHQEMTSSDQRMLFQLTSLFERIIWLTRRIVLLKKESLTI